MPEDHNPGSPTDPTPRRRRRRSGGPTANAAIGAATAVAGSATLSFWQRWSQRLGSFGLSATSRAYLFVTSIVAILAFLLYNESIIRDFRGQADNQVQFYADLLAYAYSPQAGPEVFSLIVNEILLSPRADYFPQIHTDPTGDIQFWRGQGLPNSNNRSPEAMEILDAVLQRMDEANEPISFPISPGANGVLHYDRDNLIITDFANDIIGWRGPHLPAEGDTSETVQPQLRLAIARMDTNPVTPPYPFTIPAHSFYYLYRDYENFIIADSIGTPVNWLGVTLPTTTDTSTMARTTLHSRMLYMAANSDPYIFRLAPESLEIHYGDSSLVRRMSSAMYIQISALLLFILIAFVGFRNIRRSEQRSIWVGMAKETAHQLGTPLSSLSGWLELVERDIQIATSECNHAVVQRIGHRISEMQKDMRHLNQIASRFSQIGSVPELHPQDPTKVLSETIQYFQSRSPQFGTHEISLQTVAVPPILLNAELLSWAFENLFKNSIDAFETSAGSIRVHVGHLPDRGGVIITVRDNGRGIRPENVSRVFEPGFSTKKRGWGLGLAFVKRIIEEYHGGRITVGQSVPSEGTTFEVVLPYRNT